MLTKENVTALQNSFDGVRCAHFRCRFGKVIFCLLFSYFCCCCRSWTYSLYFCLLVFSLLSLETCSRARFIHARYAIHTFSNNRILYIFSSNAVSSVGCLFLLIQRFWFFFLLFCDFLHVLFIFSSHESSFFVVCTLSNSIFSSPVNTYSIFTFFGFMNSHWVTLNE